MGLHNLQWPRSKVELHQYNLTNQNMNLQIINMVLAIAYLYGDPNMSQRLQEPNDIGDGHTRGRSFN